MSLSSSSSQQFFELDEFEQQDSQPGPQQVVVVELGAQAGQAAGLPANSAAPPTAAGAAKPPDDASDSSGPPPASAHGNRRALVAAPARQGGVTGREPPTKAAGRGLRKSVSQSMLELDPSSHNGGFQVQWSELSFGFEPGWVARRLAGKRPTRVLRNLSGRFRSNQLVAVVGPSGCGKTTLLQFLAGNRSEQRDRLRIWGLERPKVAFIGQDDCLLPGLSAFETLMFASRLQNSQPHFDHAQHVKPILNELGLADCAQQNVSKLSGGQAKRVTIAQELLYPTNLLVLDEVTSGLDASTSYSIVKLLKYLVADTTYPMTIVMSIHQPSARLFAIFDRVYVMSQGECLYEGGAQVEAINSHLGRFGLECPKFTNMADYLIEIACDELAETTRAQLASWHRKSFESSCSSREDAEEEAPRLSPSPAASQKLPQRDQDEDLLGAAAQTTSLLKSQDSEQGASLFETIEGARNGRPRPLMKHLIIHLSRSLLRIRRSYILTYLQLATYIFLGLQLATFYGPQIGQLSGCPRLSSYLLAIVLSSGHSLEADSEGASEEIRRIQENMNFLLVTVMTATFAALEITVITFPLEAKTVKREWRNGWYKVSSYFLGRTLADLPFSLGFVMIFSALIYTLTGQIGLATWRFGSFVLVVAMTALIAQSFGFTFGALFMNNLPAAVFMAPLCIFPALLFSGFFSRVSQIPTLYKPLTYLSPFRYAFDALLVTLYGFGRCHCDQAALTGYHQGLASQQGQMRDMFRYLFGSNDCELAGESSPVALLAAPSEGVALDDLSAISKVNSSLGATLASMTKSLVVGAANTSGVGQPSSSTGSPAAAGGSLKPLEDALLESLFEHMNSTEGPTTSPISDPSRTGEEQTGGNSVMEHLAQKFAHRVTSMLNRQSNYGHPLPEQCSKFDSYLMTEFDLNDENLLLGLLMLLTMVIVTRLICAAILNVTIGR